MHGGCKSNHLRKGSDTRLILLWLLDYLAGPWNLNDVLQAALLAGTGMDSFHRLCFTTPDRVWLDTANTLKAGECLAMFIVHYYAAARLCFQRKLLFFNLTPKYHYILHLHDDLCLKEGQVHAINPAAWSTQMAEDHVGVSSRLSRNVHQRTVAKRTGERWLIHIFAKWAALKKLPV